jgi:hypothetical protein
LLDEPAPFSNRLSVQQAASLLMLPGFPNNLPWPGFAAKVGEADE